MGNETTGTHLTSERMFDEFDFGVVVNQLISFLVENHVTGVRINDLVIYDKYV